MAPIRTREGASTLPPSLESVLSRSSKGSPCRAMPSWATAWRRIGVGTRGETVDLEPIGAGECWASVGDVPVLLQRPPCPIALPSCSAYFGQAS